MRPLLSLFLLLFFGISSAQELPKQTFISEPDQVLKQIGTKNFVVIDVRPPEKYQEGHIDGSINIPVDNTFDKTNNVGLLAPISSIQDLFSKKGVTNEMELVLYDNGDFIHAARLFWVLEVFGHQKVSLLNSGYQGWVKQGLPVSRQIHELPPNNYVPAISSDRLATAFSTRLAIEDKNKTILDVRSPEEYLGKKSKSSRFGHIPRAINIPWDKVIDKSLEEPKLFELNKLSQIYGDIDKESRVIAYCNKGKQSGLTYFILRNLGYDVAAYDGSWSEWGNDSSMPIVGPEN